MKKSYIVLITILVIVVLDQWLKIYIKTSIPYGDGFDILGIPWAKIHFVENEGMAFGLSFGGKSGKFVLSVFRILMVGVLIYLLRGMMKSGEPLGLIISFSMIIAGAIGNIIDSAVYGLIFSESYIHSGLATMFPEDGGYAGFLQGKVVDMFYFPIIDTFWPEWVPWIGGNHFQFFRPVFNVADASISVGVITILLFHRKFFLKPTSKEKTAIPAIAAVQEEE